MKRSGTTCPQASSTRFSLMFDQIVQMKIILEHPPSTVYPLWLVTKITLTSVAKKMMILASMQCHADVDGDREFQVQASQCASRHFFTACRAQPSTSPLLPSLQCIAAIIFITIRVVTLVIAIRLSPSSTSTRSYSSSLS